MWSEFDDEFIGEERNGLSWTGTTVDPKRLIVNWGSGMFMMNGFRPFSRTFLIHKYVHFGMSLWQLFTTNPMNSVRMDLEGMERRKTGFLARSDLDPEVDPHELGM